MRFCISFLFSAFKDTHKSRTVHNFFSAFLFCMSFLPSNSNYFAVVDIAEKEPSKVSSQQQQAASSVSWLQARVSVPVSLPARAGARVSARARERGPARPGARGSGDARARAGGVARAWCAPFAHFFMQDFADLAEHCEILRPFVSFSTTSQNSSSKKFCQNLSIKRCERVHIL